MNWKRWLIVGVVAGVLATTAGPWVYINLIRDEAPAPLTETTGDQASEGSAPATLEGEWTVGEGSVAGYRVEEVLFGQNATAVGRTTAVTGSMTVDGTTITIATFTADMTTVRSDEERRDNQFRGRIMDTTTYPTSVFELTEPIEFAATPAEGSTVTKTVLGKLTLRGTTKTVNVELTGSRSGGVITVAGQIPITFAEWGIPNPSFGPAQTEDHGILEFSLKLTHA